MAFRWADGDTLTAACLDQPEAVRVRVRGVDSVERGEAGWADARLELQNRTAGRLLTVRPHHRHGQRVVADVFAGAANVGAEMDAAGWSKAPCPRR